MTLVLRYAARSDRGLVRGNNEDSVYAGARLLALADGMGGHAAGEVASQLMIAALAPLDEDEPGDDLLGKLDRATRAGNAAIAEQVAAEPELDGMGTTLTAFLFSSRKLGMVHIGDSRAYLLRDQELSQITRDDTFVQSLVDEGRITPEQAHTHPQRSLIMRALTGNEIDPTLVMREARAGDRYLLCSDGLSDVVSDETIAGALSAGSTDECADRLIELALRGGGPDNVTVVVADVIDLDFGQDNPIVGGAASSEDDQDAPPPNTAAGRAAAMRPKPDNPRRNAVATAEPEAKRGGRLWWLLLALALVAAVGVAVVVGYRMVRANYYVGTDGNKVVVLQGLPGTFLGITLHDVHMIACVTSDNELTLNTAGAAAGPDCHELTLSDLAPSGRDKVKQGLPPGSLDKAREQMQVLAHQELLPACRNEPVPPPAIPPAPGAPSVPGQPAPTPGQPPTPAAAPPPDGHAPPPPAPTPAPGAPTSAAPETPPAAPQIAGENCRVTD